MPYIGVSPFNGVRKKHTYTATASQTSFSGAGTEGITLSYKDSTFVDVYQNGVKLGEADYTSTSGTAIVLGTGASLNDLVEVVVYDVFSVADTVSKADGGTFDGNVTMGGTVDISSTLTVDTDTLIVDASSDKIGMGVDPSTMPSFATHSIKTTNGGGVSITSASASDNRYIFFGNGTSSSDIQLAAIKNTSSDLSFLGASGQVQMVIDSTGAITKPLQSSFSAAPSADINNITGDATTASLTNVAYTEAFDVNADFNHDDGTNRGKFTAPVTGKYYLGYTLCYSGTTSASTSGVHALATSNRTYNNNFNPFNHANVGVNGNIVFSAICDMDANDTAHVTLYVNGNGAKVVDILASQHKFFGMLIG